MSDIDLNKSASACPTCAEECEKINKRINKRKLSDIKKLAGRGSKVMLTKSMHEIAELSGKIRKTDDVVEKMTKEFVDFYSKNIAEESTLKTGVLDFLKWCKKNSISMGVCTNKQEHLSIDLLKKIKIYHFFDYVAGGNTFSLSLIHI